jgi:hypothetical protein
VFYIPEEPTSWQRVILNDSPPARIILAYRISLNPHNSRPDGSWRLLGSLNPYLNEALQFVMQQKAMTARDLADDTQVEISLASTKLFNLFKARLVQRSSERLPDGSRQPGALRKGGVQMKAPTIRFSLDVPELLRLQELARQRDQSVSKLLQDLVNQAIAAIPGDGRKVGNTKNDTEQHR